MERNSLASNSSASNPLVSDLDVRLRAMRSALVQSLDNAIASLNTSISSLQRSESTSTAKIASTPTQARYLLSVERQQKVKEALYLYLLQKREENELAQNYVSSKVRIISQPLGSPSPIAPKKQVFLMIGFVIGLILPLGIIYLRMLFDNSVRERKDIERLRIPFIGEIPLNNQTRSITDKIRPHKDVAQGIVVAQKNLDIINEAFRVLRTNLSFITSKDAGCKVIMVTSFNPGSGKTFVAMNLAVSLALNGKKVLVIDGDMRRGSTSAYVGSPSKGMSNYLVGESDNVNGLIVSDTIIKGLGVLPVGTIPPNPTELLESPRFAEMIENLRQDYDYIFVDCAPIEMMADAQIIESVVDRTIFVIRAGLLERSMLPELERIYQDKKYRNMGLVLNATEAEGSRYGYKYGYGYGYGYGNYSHYTSTEK